MSSTWSSSTAAASKRRARDRIAGSTFVVHLPLPALELTLERSSPVPQQRDATTRANLENVRVLVVDDDLDTRDMLREALAACGARVTLAGNVAEAIDAFTREPPDVLVSDLGMPAETGFDLIQWVRALPADAGGKVPAAALTAYTREADQRSVLAAGFELHIAKPIDPDDLCASVGTLSRFVERPPREPTK